jgi:hypothetical protein
LRLAFPAFKKDLFQEYIMNVILRKNRPRRSMDAMERAVFALLYPDFPYFSCLLVFIIITPYEGVSRSFQTGCLE